MSTYTGTYQKIHASSILRSGDTPVFGHDFALSLEDFGVDADDLQVNWYSRGALVVSHADFAAVEDVPVGTVNFNTTPLQTVMSGRSITAIVPITCIVFNKTTSAVLCSDVVNVKNTATPSTEDPTTVDISEYMRKDVYDQDRDGYVDVGAYDGDQGTWE